MCVALVIAGVASSGIGIIQVFARGIPDDVWISSTGYVGRASGNLRQPNQLGTLLLWSLMASIWLFEARVLRFRTTVALAAAFVLVLVLTGSRAGLLGLAIIVAWCSVERRLSRRARGILFFSPIFYAVCWAAVFAWARDVGDAFGDWDLRRQNVGFTSGRAQLWSQAWRLIINDPWTGVGCRPIQLRDHADTDGRAG